MKLVIQRIKETYQFLVKYRSVPTSGVVLDFKPTIEKANFFEKENYVLIHLRARPVNNKSLWTWGVFDGQQYHSLDHIDSNFGLFSAETNEENVKNPPSHVLVIRNCRLLKRENIGFLKMEK